MINSSLDFPAPVLEKSTFQNKQKLPLPQIFGPHAAPKLVYPIHFFFSHRRFSCVYIASINSNARVINRFVDKRSKIGRQNKKSFVRRPRSQQYSLEPLSFPIIVSTDTQSSLRSDIHRLLRQTRYVVQRSHLVRQNIRWTSE